MRLDPPYNLTFKEKADRDGQKVLSRKPLSEGTLSVSEVLCMTGGCGAVCPHSSTFPVIDPGRLIPCWRGYGVSQIACMMEESQLGRLGELAGPQAPGTIQGKVPRSKAVA